MSVSRQVAAAINELLFGFASTAPTLYLGRTHDSLQ